jgi:predicted kinase
MTSLTIIRGVPGSGKSTLAKKLQKAMGTMTTDHFEADQFFIVDGVYKYDGMKIGAAHEWCQKQVDDALFYKRDVIVSNTFTTIKEMKAYFEMAKTHGVVPQVIHCQNEYGSVHGVPEAVMGKMRERFTYDLSSLYGILK